MDPADIAHDLRNALLVIQGYASVLRSSLEEPRQLQDVEEILKAVDRAAELTDRLAGRRAVLYAAE